MRKQRIISQMKEKINLDVKFHVILNNNSKISKNKDVFKHQNLRLLPVNDTK